MFSACFELKRIGGPTESGVNSNIMRLYANFRITLTKQIFFSFSHSLIGIVSHAMAAACVFSPAFDRNCGGGGGGGDLTIKRR